MVDIFLIIPSVYVPSSTYTLCVCARIILLPEVLAYNSPAREIFTSACEACHGSAKLVCACVLH